MVKAQPALCVASSKIETLLCVGLEHAGLQSVDLLVLN